MVGVVAVGMPGGGVRITLGQKNSPDLGKTSESSTRVPAWCSESYVKRQVSFWAVKAADRVGSGCSNWNPFENFEKRENAANLCVFVCLQEVSQASDVGSIPIARSINPVDAVEFTGFPPQNSL